MKRQNLLPQIVEPFAIVALLAFFIVPTITVINLSPITKEINKENVLGVNTFNSNIEVNNLGGFHEIIQGESLSKNDVGEYLYRTTLQARENLKTYSKPILQIQNKGYSAVVLSFYGYTDSRTDTRVSLKIGRNSYLLRDEKGNLYEQKIFLEPTSDTTVYLYLENSNRILFSEDFEMEVSVK